MRNSLRKWARLATTFFGKRREQLLLSFQRRDIWYENRKMREQYKALRLHYLDLLDTLDIMAPQVNARMLRDEIREARLRIDEIDDIFYWESIK